MSASLFSIIRRRSPEYKRPTEQARIQLHFWGQGFLLGQLKTFFGRGTAAYVSVRKVKLNLIKIISAKMVFVFV